VVVGVTGARVAREESVTVICTGARSAVMFVGKADVDGGATGGGAVDGWATDGWAGDGWATVGWATDGLLQWLKNLLAAWMVRALVSLQKH
jgi:hypothetical protein